MCPSPDPNPIPSPESDSALPVTPRYLLDVGSVSPQTEFTTVRCNNCKLPTPHQWSKIQLVPVDHEEDVLELLSKAKRLTICTQCGNMGLTK